MSCSYPIAFFSLQLLSLLSKVKDAQEQAVPSIGSPQKVISSSLQGLPLLPAASLSTPLSVKLRNADDDGEELLLCTQSTKPKLLDEKFNRALNKLLKDEDEDEDIIIPGRSDPNSPGHQNDSYASRKWLHHDTNEKKYNPFSTDSLLNSKKVPSPEKSSEEPSRVSIEIPDYSPDFNSESDMIGNVLKNRKDASENDAR